MTPNKSLMPTQKMGAVAVSGAAVVVLLYLAELLGIRMDEKVAGAIVALVAFAAGYLKTERGKHAVGTQRPILVDPPATVTVQDEAPAETNAYQPRRATQKTSEPLG